MSKYVTATTIHKQYDISRQTLVRWEKEKRIPAIRMPGGSKRLYSIEHVRRLLGVSDDEGDEEEKVNVCYARVSSSQQQDDLQRQIEYLQQQCPGEEIIQDIGSGLDFKRRGFQTLLERVFRGDIRQVTIVYRDRLCRFGIEMVEWLFRKTNTKLVVLHQTEADEQPSREQELAQDLLAIVNVFVARNNGLRAAENRRKRRRAQEEEEKEERASESDQDPRLSN
jgi:putative resolvase